MANAPNSETNTQSQLLYGPAPFAMQTGSTQAAVTTTTATSTTPYGFSTAAQANAIVTLINKMRTDLIALGLIKGSA